MLRGNSLAYFEKKPDWSNRKSASKPKGELLLNAHSVAEAHRAEDSPWESFQVTTPAKCIAVFAESRTEKEHWLRILRCVIRGDDPSEHVNAPILDDDVRAGAGGGGGAGAGARVSMPARRASSNKIRSPLQQQHGGGGGGGGGDGGGGGAGLARFRGAVERVKLQNRCAAGFYRGLTAKALSDAHVVFSGYLKKLPQKVLESDKGAKGSKAVDSAWQRRFFVLSEAALCYYGDEREFVEKKPPRLSLSLTACHARPVDDDDRGEKRQAAAVAAGHHDFKVCTVEHALFLRASSQGDRDAWVHHLMAPLRSAYASGFVNLLYYDAQDDGQTLDGLIRTMAAVGQLRGDSLLDGTRAAEAADAGRACGVGMAGLSNVAGLAAAAGMTAAEALAAQAQHDAASDDGDAAQARRSKRRSKHLERRLSELHAEEVFARPINETAHQDIGTPSYRTQHVGVAPESTRRKRSSVFRMGDK